MTHGEFFDYIQGLNEHCFETLVKKNKDYSSDEDPFRNFRLVESLGLPMHIGVLVRLMDKVSRLMTLLNIENNDGPTVVDETVSDTIQDAINYLFILDAALYEDATIIEK